MENYKEQLEQQLREFNELLKRNEQNIAKYQKLPNQRVKLSKNQGITQYYYIDPLNQKLYYAKKKEQRKVAALVQRDYEIEVNKKLKFLKGRLEKFIKYYDIDAIGNVYASLPEGKRILVNPIIKTDDQLVAEWLVEHPGMQNTFPMEGQLETVNGEHVRSKSEKIIADTLYRYNIPYQYEPLLELGNSTIYPDFVALNKRTGKTVYWEHLGLVSDSDYASKNLIKLQMYEKNGYLLGRNMIITMESSIMPLEVKLIEQKIKEFLL